MSFASPFRPLRALIAVFLIAGWLGATNHCALGLMNACAAQASCEHCAPGQKTPAGEGARACCKDLSGVILPVGCAVKPAMEAGALALWVTASEAGEEPALRHGEWDTGPPGVDWFAETVLQRVLQGNAPPARS